MPDFLTSGPDEAAWTLILAHGAGAGMDTPFMTLVAELLAARAVRVLRFEFGYMASRRSTGKRKPPPKAEALMGEYRAAVAAARELTGPGARLAIGGKSMGGRVASLVAEEMHASGDAQALICLGYPFHPPGMPEKTRTAHLAALPMPTLIVQGERDPFGDAKDVAAYELAEAIEVTWIGDGDHDFGPRGASGFTRKGNLATAADNVADFLARIADA